MITIKIEDVQVKTKSGQTAYITGIKVNDKRSPLVGHVAGTRILWSLDGIAQDTVDDMNLVNDDDFKEFVTDYKSFF
ncbi:hypothetical protein LVY74_17090 [Acinetobacter sp. ME22]|uniref:hypothetical protein n=1 Tax=Acinetobacter sp. ME22 TaxID=2904802 RepID=UPI001EDC2F09|nr:hypothetical protein [Acinetobacter sp. ME22]MCG2575254.1 hypothetical protein [Acinetobacter sp. ME22]